ncbi:MAG: hypothetical protein ACK4N5_27270 [Myxococcales bacterium]
MKNRTSTLLKPAALLAAVLALSGCAGSRPLRGALPSDPIPRCSCALDVRPPLFAEQLALGGEEELGVRAIHLTLAGNLALAAEDCRRAAELFAAARELSPEQPGFEAMSNLRARCPCYADRIAPAQLAALH